VRERLQRVLRPREGWASLALLGVMLVMLAWSLQRAEWVDHLDFLVPVAVVAAVLGALLGITRLSVALVLPLSAVVGAWFVLWTIGGEYFPELSPGGRLILLRGDALDWARIVIDGGFAPQLSPYAIALGMLMWVTAFIASYTLYRHHRVLDSILLLGVALIANMSATFTDGVDFAFLVVFSIAALLLWLRMALINREENWRIRRINENLDVPVQIMRSGMTFIAGSIALAWVLTTVAVAAPLTSVWSNLGDAWSDVRGGLEGWFGGLAGTDARIRGTNFGSSFSVSGSWTSSGADVMTVGSQRGYYMRTVTYDIYTGHGWRSSEGSDRRVAAGDRIFPGATPERPLAGFLIETVTVSMQRDGSRNIFTPGYPRNALAPLIVYQPGGQQLLGSLRSGVNLDEGKGYQITAAISNATEAMLVGAGTNYPPEIIATYTSTEGITPRTAELAREVANDAGATDPYHQAKALADYLRSDPRFGYATVAALPSDPDRDLVDFFLFDPNGQTGYCEYFATAMAVMARTLGLPARVAVGYAPGERLDTGIYQVKDKNAHLWAEVYFPGYGWQIFEATKSITPVVRLPGSGIAPPINPPVGGVDPGQQFEEGDDPGAISGLPSFEPVPGGFKQGEQRPTEGAREGNAWVIIVGLLVLGAVIAYRLIRSRYRFRFLPPGDRQWQRLAFAADRAGVAQRPSETPYEYAGWLEEQIPKRSIEIHQIADGKVWQSYSGHSISEEAIARLERAWGRLQLPLLALALRRRIRSLLGRGAAS
jgi:transglutaminase-like putative cysteine protease